MKNTLYFRLNTFFKNVGSFKASFSILLVLNIHIFSFVAVANGQADSLTVLKLDQLVSEKKYDEAIDFYKKVNETISSLDKELFVQIHELGTALYLKRKPEDYRKITLSIYDKLLAKVRTHKNRDEWIFMAGRLEALLIPASNYIERIRVYEKSALDLPEEHYGRGVFYHRIAHAYKALFDYDNFLKYSLKAKENHDKGTTKNTKQHTQFMNTLGLAYRLTGEIRESKKTFKLAKKIKLDNGEKDDQFGKITNQLASVYLLYDDFKNVKENLSLSLEAKAKKGRKTASYAKTLSSYASYLKEVKQLETALDTINSCISIAELEDRNSLLDYRQIKADILTELDSTEEAIVIYEDLIEKRTKLGREEDTNHPKVLFNLFGLYMPQKEYKKASILIEEALVLFEKIHGKNHPYYAKALIKKAEVSLKLGQELNYEEIYKTSSEIIDSVYGKKLDYFHARFELFRYYNKINQDDKAIKMLPKLDRLIRIYIKDVVTYVSNKEITNLYKAYFQEILSLTARNQKNDYLKQFVLKCSLYYKGYILKHILKVKKLVRNSSEQDENSVRLKALNNQLDEAVLANNSDLANNIRGKISLIENDMEIVKENFRTNEIFLYEFQDRLENHSIMIDFIRYYDEAIADFEYTAVLFSKESDIPTYIRLFSEKEFTKYFDNNPTSTGLAKSLYSRSGVRGTNKLIPTKGKDTLHLNELIWQKLEPNLNGIEKIYYSVDGILHNIALHAIVLDDENVVADKYQLVQITNLNTLLEEEDKYYKKQALIVGGVNYGNNELVAVSEFRGNGLPWRNLKHSKGEINTINSLLSDADYSLEVLSESQAKKKDLYEKLRKSNNLRILHFATHGAFKTDSLLGVKFDFVRGGTDIALERSALVLADANLEGETAYLTAAEISDCNLAHTELVVLSACETGLGQVYQNEGVYGLQRAFKIAGVDYIIMSLWEVNDLLAKEFMETFYGHFLAEHSIEEAFYKTQKERINNKSIEWAGFVLLK